MYDHTVAERVREGGIKIRRIKKYIRIRRMKKMTGQEPHGSDGQ